MNGTIVARRRIEARLVEDTAAIPTKEAAALLRLTRECIQWRCRRGLVDGAYMKKLPLRGKQWCASETWMVPRSYIEQQTQPSKAPVWAPEAQAWLGYRTPELQTAPR